MLEPEFSRWIQPRGGTKEKQLLCAAGFWSCTSQKGLKEAHLGAERELLLKLDGKCRQRVLFYGTAACLLFERILE